MENKIYEHCCKMADRGMGLDWVDVKRLAAKMASLAGIQNFKATDGWVRQFQHRFSQLKRYRVDQSGDDDTLSVVSSDNGGRAPSSRSGSASGGGGTSHKRKYYLHNTPPVSASAAAQRGGRVIEGMMVGGGEESAASSMFPGAMMRGSSMPGGRAAAGFMPPMMLPRRENSHGSTASASSSCSDLVSYIALFIDGDFTYRRSQNDLLPTNLSFSFSSQINSKVYLIHLRQRLKARRLRWF